MPTTIADSPICHTLKTLNLRKDLHGRGGANFEQDQSVEKLAEILSQSYQLAKCDISGQEGSRKVGVQVIYKPVAEEMQMGYVIVSDGATGEEIVRLETGKLE